MPNLRISELPSAGPITGTELVPISQNGTTAQTTTAAISGSISLNYPFITVTQQPLLTSSRYLQAGSGLAITDGLAQGPLTINVQGALASLITASNGILTKSGTTITARSIAVSGNGLSVVDADGVSANPTLLLAGLAAQVANITSGAGLIGRTSLNGAHLLTITGTANQIDVANGTGDAGNPTVSITNNPTLPGSGGVIIPSGTTFNRPALPSNGTLRYNTTTQVFEGYANNSWGAITTGSGISSITLGTGLNGTPNPITTTGTITIDNTVVATLSDVQTLTNKTISGASNTLTNIGNASLTNSSVTYNGVAVALGASGTITAASPNALTVGTGLQLNSGTTYDGSAAKTISLTNTSVTIGSTSIALGGTSLTLGGLTTVSVTQDPLTAFELTTKQYVDGLVSTGLTYHQPVQAATTQDLATQTGGTVIYNNGAGGVGATITLSVALNTLDGYSLSNTNRILVKDEINQAYNGVYTWATGGLVLTRATDADSYGTGTGDLSLNDYFFVQNGTVNKGTSYVLTTVGTITFGTTAITFAEFSTSQVYTGSSPIQVTGTVISLNTVPVASGGTNITSYAAGDLLYATGATTLSKLALGSNTYILTSSGSAPQWSVPSNITVGTATNAVNVGITDDVTTNATMYPVWVTTNTGNLPAKVTSTKLSFNPSTGILTATGGIAGGAF